MKTTKTNTPTTVTPTTQAPAPAAASDTPIRQQVVAYIPEALIVRLGQYMLAKYPGKLNVRNRIIIAAIERMLHAEGF